MRYFLLCLFIQILALPAFATDKNVNPRALLHGNQLEYYTKVFNYTMDNVQAGYSYDWNSGVAKGNVSGGKVYISKSKASCRTFLEIFTIGNESGRNTGTACKRDNNNGWCILKRKNSIQSCALENPQSSTDKTINDVKGWLGF